jgi:hypothetical protein
MNIAINIRLFFMNCFISSCHMQKLHGNDMIFITVSTYKMTVNYFPFILCCQPCIYSSSLSILKLWFFFCMYFPFLSLHDFHIVLIGVSPFKWNINFIWWEQENCLMDSMKHGFLVLKMIFTIYYFLIWSIGYVS